MGLCMMALLMFPGYAGAENFIYVLGLDNRWAPPTTAFDNWEEFYNESNRLYETSPGSNCFEGVIELPDNYGYEMSYWFRFITELSHSDNGNVYWRENVVGPAGGQYDGVVAKELGESGVYSDDLLYKKIIMNREPGTWRVTTDASRMWLHVDLANKHLYFATGTLYLLVEDGMAVPTLETIGNYRNLSSGIVLPSGDFRFRIYDFANHCFVGAAGSGDTGRINPYYGGWFDSTENDNFHWELNDFPGGVVTCSGDNGLYFYVEPAVEKANAMPQNDKYYLVGDFNGWSFSSSYVLTPNSDNTVYTGVLPAGAHEFKICSEPNWNDNYGYNGLYTKDDAGCYSMGLQRNGSNFSIRPVSHDVSLKLSVRGHISLQLCDSDAIPMDGTEGYDDSEFAQGEEAKMPYDDVMWLYVKDKGRKPTLETIDYIYKQCVPMLKDENGCYTASCYVDKYESLNIISSLGSKSQEAKVVCPVGGDVYVLDADGEFNGRYGEVNESEAGYWIFNNEVGCLVEISVDPKEKVVRFNIPLHKESANNCLYLIGSPQGWNINSPSMVLNAVNRDLYYGEFYIEEDAMFRFYRELGNWDKNSIGSQFTDYPIDAYFDNATFTGQCTNGKGPWQMRNWNSGTMHMLVDLDTWKVTFSDHPIPYTPGNVSNDADVIEYNNSTVNKYYTSPDGLVYVRGAMPGEEIKLYSRQLPLGVNEPEHDSSYALSLLSEPVFDEFGVAKVPFEIIDEITTERKAHHLCVDDKYMDSFNIVVDMENREMYLDRGYVFFVEEGASLPSYRDYRNFTGPVMPGKNGSNNIVDVPAGNHDYRFADLWRGPFYIMEESLEPVVFDENGMFMSNQFSRSGLVINDWKGGLLAFRGGSVFDLSDIKGVEAQTSSEGNPYQLKMDSSTPGRFGGMVSLDTPEGLSNYILMKLKLRDNATKTLNIGPRRSNLVGSNLVSDRVWFADGRKSTIQLGIETGYIYLPTVKSGRVSITLDLLGDKAILRLEEGEIANAFEVYGANIDAYATPSYDEGGLATVQIGVSSYEPFEFNLGDMNGKILVPVSGKEKVSPDKFGVWRSKYEVVSVDKAVSRRAKASGERKWKLEVPSNGVATIAVDEEKQELIIVADPYNETYFISEQNADDMEWRVAPVIGNLNRLKARAMVATAPGKFKGEFNIPKSSNSHTKCLYVHKNVAPSVKSMPATGLGLLTYSVIDLDQDKDVCEYACLDSFGCLYIEASDKVTGTIEYDEESCILRIYNVVVGTDEVWNDSTLQIMSDYGGVRFMASEDTETDIYNLMGQKIAHVKLNAGETRFVSLSQGIYIADGRKIAVK